MARPERRRTRTRKGPRIRAGESDVHVFNSGLEVWLYDDANRETIRSATDAGRQDVSGQYAALFGQGLLVGYSLYQDDEVRVAVVVGNPLTAHELAAGRWLEPQHAFLQLPSGKLSIESNDASRIGPDRPAAEGGRVDVPPGDYRVTLYRIDYEALSRERVTWTGPQEVIVLTAGGTEADAAPDLLPFQLRRDTSWVGRYTVRGRTAEALAWFSDYWDTFVVNLDRTAASQMGIVPGAYVSVHVPAVGLTFVTAFADSWNDARQLPPPAGPWPDEYGYAAFTRMSEWDGVEVLFCRRDRTTRKVDDEHHTTWHPATVEVLDVEPAAAPAGPSLVPGGARPYLPSNLKEKRYFDDEFLVLILCDLLRTEREELPLAVAVGLLDKAMAAGGLTPQGDFSYEERRPAGDVEFTCRVYTGLPDMFGLIWATEGSIDVVLLTELGERQWLVSGLADAIGTAMAHGGGPRERIQVQEMDEPLRKIFAAHKKALARTSPRPAPTSFVEGVAAWNRFVEAAFD